MPIADALETLDGYPVSVRVGVSPSLQTTEGWHRVGVADRRYSTAAWRRLRKQVIIRAGGLCEVQGPRCTGVASTAHRILPTSQYPERFWDPANLQASCKPCNDHGAVIRSDNRANRQVIAELERTIDDLQAEVDELTLRLAAAENGTPARKPAMPRIY